MILIAIKFLIDELPTHRLLDDVKIVRNLQLRHRVFENLMSVHAAETVEES